MDNIILLFCEGSHEPPYIYRILKADGWSNKTDQPINTYPSVIGGYLKAQLSKTEKLSDEDPWNRDLGFMPWYILLKQTDEISNYILVFRLGGESKYNQAITCMELFQEACSSDFDDDLKNIELKVAFFYDADKGIDYRIKRFVDNMEIVVPEFCQQLKESAFKEYFHLDKKIDNLQSLGLFIFHDEKGAGALESHVLPLMRQGYEEIFDDAHHYMNLHFGKVKPEKKFDLMIEKSIIGITGQLQKSGRSNSVYVSDCDYITDAKILGFEPTQKLIEFVNHILL